MMSVIMQYNIERGYENQLFVLSLIALIATIHKETPRETIATMAPLLFPLNFSKSKLLKLVLVVIRIKVS